MEIKITSRSRSVRNSLHYLFFSKDGKFNIAHPNNNGIHNRNELVSGINTPGGNSINTYHQSLKNFKYYLDQKPHQKVQCVNLVLSFSKSDFHFVNKDGSVNKEDCFRADKLAREFIKKAFGKDRISLQFLQCDNRNCMPHIHISLMPLNIADPSLRSLNGKDYNIYRLRKIGDRLVKNYNQKHPDHKLVDIRRIAKKNRIYRNYGLPYRAPANIQSMMSEIKLTLNNPSINTKTKLRKSLKLNGIIMITKRTRASSHNHRKVNRRGALFKSSQSNGFIKCSFLAKYDPYFKYGKINRRLKNNWILSHRSHRRSNNYNLVLKRAPQTNNKGDYQMNIKKSESNKNNQSNQIIFRNLIIPSYIQKYRKDKLGSIKQLIRPIYHHRKAFKIAFLKRPNKPIEPLMKVFNKDDTKVQKLLKQQLNANEFAKYKQKYNDYLDALMTYKDVLSITKAVNARIKKQDYYRGLH